MCQKKSKKSNGRRRRRGKRESSAFEETDWEPNNSKNSIHSVEITPDFLNGVSGRIRGYDKRFILIEN